MTNIVVGIVIVVITAILLFVSALLGTAFGAFAGWVLSLTFLGDLIIGGFKVFGLDAAGKLVMIGALFGFVAGFFKPEIKTKSD
jgi:polyferredoxin